MTTKQKSQHTAHTAGPWRVETLRDGHPYVGSDLHDVANIPYNLNGRPYFLANAHLIAAAPEMLEALEGLCTWAATHHDADFEGAGDTHHMITEWRKARAAIRKARGEE